MAPTSPFVYTLPAGDCGGEDQMFAEFMRHVGHDVEIVTYGDVDKVWSVALECITCNEGIEDYDR